MHHGIARSDDVLIPQTFEEKYLDISMQLAFLVDLTINTTSALWIGWSYRLEYFRLLWTTDI